MLIADILAEYPIANPMISATLEMRVVLQKFHHTECGSDYPISLQSLLGLLAKCSEVLMARNYWLDN